MNDSLLTYLGYGFVQNALLAGTCVAILGAIVGYFVVIRNVSFAAHALSHIGFAGAAGAAIFGLSPLEGMLLLTVGSGAFMGAAGEKVQRSDMAIAMVLSAALGLGLLFLNFYTSFAGQAVAILFGDIFGVAGEQIFQIVLLSSLSLGALAVFSRRLLFASMQPRLAEARGLPLPALSIAFMVVVAVSVTLASQIVGILLVFTLVVAPAGISLRLCRSFAGGMTASILLGVAGVWTGVLTACLTNWPPAFCITAFFFLIYLGVEGYCRIARRGEH